MQILPFSDLIDVHWKNGGGITRDIAKGLKNKHLVWRLSRADVAQNGAFSNFAGLERILTVVSDTGMVLEYPGGQLDADPWLPVRFSGALPVVARLKDGGLTDLNLMFDPSLCDGSVTVLRGPIRDPIDAVNGGVIAVHVLAGQPVLGGRHLDVGDTAFVEGHTAMALGAGDAVLEIRLRYLRQDDAIRLCIAKT